MSHDPSIGDHDLRAYLARIGHKGDLSRRIETVEALVSAHARMIPFSGLDPFRGVPVSLEPQDIVRKLVAEGRGGYCHEQNALMQSVLALLGFDVRALSARVIWMRPSRQAPATHRMTLLQLNGRQYIVDVGFGPNTPTIPLLLSPELRQVSPQASYRIMSEGHHFRLDIETSGTWEPLYLFATEPTDRATFEVANWFTSTHPRSLFVTNLIVSRTDQRRYLGLINRKFVIRGQNQVLEEKMLSSADELEEVLRDSMSLNCGVPAAEIWNKLPLQPVPAWP